MQMEHLLIVTCQLNKYRVGDNFFHIVKCRRTFYDNRTGKWHPVVSPVTIYSATQLKRAVFRLYDR